MKVKEVTCQAPHSPPSIFLLFQDVAQRDLNESFVLHPSPEPPELDTIQKSTEITKRRQPTGGALFFLLLT
jgi:hypothetical protein